uniref:Uncharacterized protein n=1 Tax=Oryza rufipogon TaxID=4529 RepID=A0A0E0QWV6_ORYRU
MNGEYKSIWKWNYIINLGLSPKISNVDDVAQTVMWPSTLMRILYLSPSTTLCLQIDSHHARERGSEEGTGGQQKKGGGGGDSALPSTQRSRRGGVERWRWQPGGGGCSRDSALPSARCSRRGGGEPRRLPGDGPVEAIAAWEGHRRHPSSSPSHHHPIGARAARSSLPHTHRCSRTAKSGIAPPHRRLGVARSRGGGRGGWAQGTLAVVKAGRGRRLPQRCSGLPPQ